MVYVIFTKFVTWRRYTRFLNIYDYNTNHHWIFGCTFTLSRCFLASSLEINLHLRVNLIKTQGVLWGDETFCPAEISLISRRIRKFLEVTENWQESLVALNHPTYMLIARVAQRLTNQTETSTDAWKKLEPNIVRRNDTL